MTKTKKVKKVLSEPQETMQQLPFVPPETHYLSEHYIVKLPVSDPRFGDPWQLRLYVAKLVEHRLGDQVQLTSMKIRQPHVIAKGVARLRKREPVARAFVTIAF